MSNAKGFRFKKSELGIFKGENASLALSSFENGCRIMGLTRGEFSLIDLIYAILKKTGPAEVACVTWSAGIKDVHNVKWMVDSHLIEKFTLITDHSYKTRQSKYAASIEELFGIENIRTSEIHAKFILIKNEAYNVTIRTSMNLNANKTCESFEIDEDKSIFDFYDSFVQYIYANQKHGFVKESKTVNETLDGFFNSKIENKIKGWSEL